MPPKFQAGVHLAAKPGRSQTMNHLHLQPTGCRLGLPTWRSSLRGPTWVRVKAGKTKTYGHRHLVSPMTHPSEHTFDPRVKSGQTGSNQKTNFWRLQPAGCRPGLPTRRPGLRCQAVLGAVKPDKTKLNDSSAESKPVKPSQTKINHWQLQSTGCRPGLRNRRPRSNQVAVKPGKTNLTNSSGGSGPVKPGQTKMSHWQLQPTGCRSGLPPRRSGLRWQAEVRLVKPGQTKINHWHLQPADCRPDLRTRRPRSNQVTVKAGKTKKQPFASPSTCFVPFHLISFRVFTGHILASNVKNHHPAAH
jgi:hypothetical protein